jgi:cystathionine beta-lyase
LSQVHSFDELTEEQLRRRQSAKWKQYASDVLPAWVAEMDFPLAEPIRQALERAVGDGDTGYAFPAGVAEAFARWASRRWGWEPGPADVRLVADVVTGIAEVLRVATAPGDADLIEPPVYPPVAGTRRETGRRVVTAPLRRRADRWEPDLEAIARGYQAGVRAHLVCSPQNPTGLVYDKDTLAAIAGMASRYGVLVVSDEIHAPLALPGTTHCPFPTASEQARRTAVVLASASKAWNIAGLKAALVIASSDETRALVARIPVHASYRAGHFGVLAARTAFDEGDAWLAAALEILDRNRKLLSNLLATELPGVVYLPPRAGYLAWLDCRGLGLGDDPAEAFLTRGRVALSSGPSFGEEGKGFARLNIATTRTLLEEAVHRMARATSTR